MFEVTPTRPHQVKMAFTQEEMEYIDKQAEHLGFSRQDFIRFCLSRYSEGQA